MENYEKYEKLITQMKLEEKISMLSGANFWNTESIERLGIPSMMLTDGPHGLRKQGGKADHLGLNASIPSTCFPTAATLANSWDVNLAREVGECLAREAAHEDVSALMGPGLNIKRNPLCGRNFEYFSEDPYLSGNMARGLAQGIEGQGVSSCLKHFAVNSQERLRMSINEVVDKRALHEIYLEGFRIALKAKPKMVMTSYNKVNGEFANENEYLIKDTLKARFGFKGLIVTDWGGNNDRVQALKVGNQLEMPASGGVTDQELQSGLKEGIISEHLIDVAVADILEVVFTTKRGVARNKADTTRDYNLAYHHNKAVQVAEQSIVMLKNQVLPLKPNTKIGIIGDFAFKPRYQGAGSSLIEPTKLERAVDVFANGTFDVIGHARGFKRYGGNSKRLAKKAVELASKSEYVLYFMGLDESSESEGLDRNHMRIMDNQIDVLKQIYRINQNIIIILAGGAPIELGFEKYSKAILHGYLGGQGINQGLYNIISGKTNPSGKLAETYPYSWHDVLSSKYYPGMEATSEHRESIFVGYRYFETANIDVRYPFGYGLSYTEFTYSDLKQDQKGISFTIENSADVFGKEIAQMYIRPIDSNIFRSRKELKGFIKVGLEAGQSKQVRIEFDDHTFSYFNVKTDDWEQELGYYVIEVGSSIKDIRLETKIELTAKVECTQQIAVDRVVLTDDLYNHEKLSDYYQLRTEIRRSSFAYLYGEELPQAKWNRDMRLSLGDVIVQSEYQGILGKCIFKLLIFINKLLLKMKKPIIANYVYFLIYMPWRQVSRFSNGKIKESQVENLLLKL